MWRKPRVTSGRAGDHWIETYEVSESEAKRYNMLARIRRERTQIEPGQYVRLMRRGDVVMSNTPDEWRDHYEFIRDASGRVLIIGLGLGMVLDKVLEKSSVKHVTVVERELEVVRLVWPEFFNEGRARLVMVDLNDWNPSPEQFGRFDSAWVDIWDTWGEMLYPEYSRARRVLSGVCAPVHIRCWKEDEVKTLVRSGR